MTRFPIFLFVFTALLAGCDLSKPEVEPEELKADPSPETAEASPKAHSLEEEEPVEQPEPEKEPEEPVLTPLSAITKESLP
jgi:hypothetical protein